MVSAALNATPQTGGVDRYYTKHGEAHDGILRCVDCKAIVRHADLVTRRSCRCGCQRMKEVTTLTTWEWVRIRLGLLRFPRRQEFLREFGRVR